MGAAGVWGDEAFVAVVGGFSGVWSGSDGLAAFGEGVGICGFVCRPGVEGCVNFS